MDTSAIADIVTILFFLWYALKTFIPALQKGYFSYLGGVLALIAVIVLFIDRSP